MKRILILLIALFKFLLVELYDYPQIDWQQFEKTVKETANRVKNEAL